MDTATYDTVLTPHPIPNHRYGNRTTQVMPIIAAKDDRQQSKPAYNLSKFPHENMAISQILDLLAGAVELIPNYFLFDPSTNQYLECDIIAIATTGISVIDLKHWTGRIDILPHQWLINRSSYRKDPHISNKYKCQVLRTLYENVFSTFPAVWVESIIVLTNPDAEIEGDSHYKTVKNNLTFRDIERLARYFKHRAGNPDFRKLTTAQAKSVAEKLRLQSGHGQSSAFNLPGYEILENLTYTPERIELLARPAGNQLQTIQKIRVFLDNYCACNQERNAFRSKAYNSLKAIAAIGDHPNINKVWQIPHEDGFVIEASDWTQKGTLADHLTNSENFTLKDILKIIGGLLDGLAAIHAIPVIHRAINPQNVLIVRGIPKIINFDLSYLYEDDRYTVLPEVSKLKSNPYIAPEIYARQDISNATDLFSVGVILYEMLTGALPFKSSKELLDVSNDVATKRLMVGMVAANVSEELQIIVLALLDTSPQKRPQSAEEVIEVMASLLEGCDIEKPQSERTNRMLEQGEVCRIYEIEKLIGKGRSAQVYQVRRMTQAKLVLKLFYHEISRDRIKSEHSALQRAECPYVVRCEGFDKWDNDGRFFLVLNLIEGDSLRTRIQKQMQPELAQFRQVIHCLFEALAKMHSIAGDEPPLLHCDIKPENIILTPEGYPVLIDFGTATTPHVGAYMGTEGYVAPDLVNGVDLEFCVSGDLFALGVTCFEWFFGVSPFQGKPSQSMLLTDFRKLRNDVPEDLADWFETSVQPHKSNRFRDIWEMRKSFEDTFTTQEPGDDEVVPPIEPDVILPDLRTDTNCNGFVNYLNTLHNLTPANLNSLAEAQALNQYFGAIHVPASITDFIIQNLTAENGSHVILTGHAGDGKSTIGLELFKHFKSIPMSTPLLEPMTRKEQIDVNGAETIVLIKDMSELSEHERIEEFISATSNNYPKTRWFIISNTGNLLETMIHLADVQRLDRLALEDRILQLLEGDEPGRLELAGTSFTVINLARMDNTATAEQLFIKLLDNHNWQCCRECHYNGQCSIAANVITLNEALETALQRVSYVYRRLYEYGSRLTMRQVAGHFAYSITSGLSCLNVAELFSKKPAQEPTAFHFFNRFFGFKGNTLDENALRLHALAYLIPLEMGTKPFPPLERQLWLKEGQLIPNLPESLDGIFNQLKNEVLFSTNHSPSRVRQQMRRLLYIYGDHDTDQAFIASFVDSPMLMEFMKWRFSQYDPASLTMTELRRNILRVLQEQYTGVQLAANYAATYLYITLKRGNEELWQTVQILLAQIPLSNFSLVFRNNKRSVPTLVEKESNEMLDLELPFLDFVILRSMGEIGQKLDTGYTDRLKRFKAGLLKFWGHRMQTDLVLIETGSDADFKTYQIAIKKNTLQVT